MSTVCSANTHRMEIVPGGGPLVACRVLRGPGAGAGPHVLAICTQDSWVPTGVDVMTSAEVPADVLAIGDELADELGITAGAVPQWRLDHMPPVDLRRITLEQSTERDPKQAVRELAHGGLVGRVFWWPSAGEVRLWVDEVPFRVRGVEPGGRVNILARLTERTAVELYVPAARAGVDIAVLADTSGSMSVDDLPLTGNRPHFRKQSAWITRIDALREALNDLLAMRLQISGRVSSFALLGFDDNVRQRFPREGGMAPLDRSSSQQEIEEFRSAVAMLRPAQAGTDMGKALHEAANLLYRHGKSGNEKLIVLVTDVNWRPKGNQGTGEMMYAYEEPVSLMRHLHETMAIRLHAVGISTADLFRQRGAYHPHPSLVPDHALLEELGRR